MLNNNIQKNTICKAISVHSTYKIVNNLSKSTRQVYNFIILLKSRYHNLYPSQSYIAKCLGIRRQTVNEALKRLEKYKLLESTYYHFQTKSYRLGAIIHNPYIRSALLCLLPALHTLPIFGSLRSFSQKADTIIKKEINLLSLNNREISSSTKKKEIATHICFPVRIILKSQEKGDEYMKPLNQFSSATTNTHKEFDSIIDLMLEEKSDNAYYAVNHRVKNVNSTTKTQSPIQTVTKNTQQGESHKSFSLKQPDLSNVIINRAKRLFEEAKRGRRNRFYIRQNLSIVMRDFPHAIDHYKSWLNSSDGKEFKIWLG